MKKILFLAFILLNASIALAVTPVTRYVRTDCANNGDGTASSCAASGGAAGAYKTLSQGFVDVSSDYPDFVSSDVQVTLDLAGATADTTEVSLTFITVDATRYLSLLVTQANRHDGKWNTGKYRLVAPGYDGVLEVRLAFTRIEGLQIEQNRTGASPGGKMHGIVINNSTASAYFSVDNCILRYTGDYTNQEAFGLYDAHDGAGTTVVFRNNIAYDFNFNFFARTEASDTIYLYNNTGIDSIVDNFGYRLYGSGATFTMINNLAQGSTGSDYNADGSSGATFTTSNNIAEDASSPDASYQSKVVTFVNEAGDDLHLDSSDSEAVNNGADLSAATQGMTTDIDGQIRSGTWDIGADEYQAPGGGGESGNLQGLNYGLNLGLNRGLN